jgi:hypothetical protein
MYETSFSRAPVNPCSYALKNDLAITLTARIDPTLSRSAIGGKLPLFDSDDASSSSSGSNGVVTLAPGTSAVIRATPGEATKCCVVYCQEIIGRPLSTLLPFQS